MDTKGPISPSSDGNSYVYVIVDVFTHFVFLHPSPKNDATNALTVLFDDWNVKFGIPDILVTDKEMNNLTENSQISAVHIMYNSNLVRHSHRGLMDSLKIVTAN